MKSLTDLKTHNITALKELRALRTSIATQHVSIANAGVDAAGDPAAKAALTAARQAKLRELEDQALAKIDELRAIEKETRTILAGGLGVAMSASERAEAAHLATLYPKQAEGIPLAEIQSQLQAAVLHEDRPAMFFFGQIVRTRLQTGGPTFGGDTRDQGREDGVSRGRLQTLLTSVEASLRDRSADPVIAAADQVRDAADDLKGSIWRARATRGEGSFQAQGSGPMVKLAGDDSTGWHAADDLAS